MAFLTTAHKNEEGEIFFNDINNLLDQRDFYDYPIRVSRMNSYLQKPLNA